MVKNLHNVARTFDKQERGFLMHHQICYYIIQDPQLNDAFIATQTLAHF